MIAGVLNLVSLGQVTNNQKKYKINDEGLQ